MEELSISDSCPFPGVRVDELSSIRLPSLKIVTVSRKMVEKEQGKAVGIFLRSHPQLHTVRLPGHLPSLPANIEEVQLPYLTTLCISPETLDLFQPRESVTSLKIMQWDVRRTGNDDLAIIRKASQYSNVKCLELSNREWYRSSGHDYQDNPLLFYDTILHSFQELEDLTVTYYPQYKGNSPFSWVCVHSNPRLDHSLTFRA